MTDARLSSFKLAYLLSGRSDERAYTARAILGDVMVRSVSPEVEDIRSIFAKRHEGRWLLGADVVFPGDDAWPAPDIDLTSSSRDGVLEAVADRLAPHTVPIAEA